MGYETGTKNIIFCTKMYKISEVLRVYICLCVYCLCYVKGVSTDILEDQVS